MLLWHSPHNLMLLQTKHIPSRQRYSVMAVSSHNVHHHNCRKLFKKGLRNMRKCSSVNLASKFLKSQSNWASVVCAGTSLIYGQLRRSCSCLSGSELFCQHKGDLHIIMLVVLTLWLISVYYDYPSYSFRLVSTSSTNTNLSLKLVSAQHLIVGVSACS